MALRPLSSANSVESNNNAVNDFMREFQGDQVVRVLKDDQGTRVLILDKDGLRTTEPGSGIDVYTATDDQLTFNSARNTLKVVASGTYSITKPASTISVEELAPHGLDYIPTLVINVESFTTSPGEWRMGVTTTHNTATGVMVAVGTADVDATNVKFKATTPSGGSRYGDELVYNYKYYLLQETAN